MKTKVGMKGYKAFNKGMICRGKQYAENTVFEEDAAIICEKGMHFCERPLDVLGYYDPVNEKGEFTEFAEVEALDDPVTDDNKKYCSKKLKIGSKVTIGDLVNATVDFDLKKAKAEPNTGNCSASSHTGNCSATVATGIKCSLDVSGKSCIAVSWGIGGKAKGAIGSYLVLSEWTDNGELVTAKMAVIDGEKIKADTWYKLENGVFVEVDNAEA